MSNRQNNQEIRGWFKIEDNGNKCLLKVKHNQKVKR